MLQNVFGFKRCTLSVNTLHLVLKHLDVAASGLILQKWVDQQLEAAIPWESIAIDGKAVHGAKEQNLPYVHLLSAFASISSKNF
ncbi:MAG: hypothetical protein JO235_28040 [Chroococcidiopsidaceae cyanobacterium CP_BM_RX_35]|nr:hypothetical protein [Chroococcidiopsidaceae cyanobacterium CP_BM_RX_35]